MTTTTTTRTDLPANTMFVENEVQACLFINEISGQISDGHWENARGTCWETWCDADVRVGDDDTFGTTFSVRRRRFNLVDKDLLDVVAPRMIVYAKLARMGYTPEQANMIETAMIAGLVGSTVRPIADWVLKYAANDPNGHYSRVVRLCRVIDPARLQSALDADTYDITDLRHDLRALMDAMRTDARTGARVCS